MIVSGACEDGAWSVVVGEMESALGCLLCWTVYAGCTVISLLLPWLHAWSRSQQICSSCLPLVLKFPPTHTSTLALLRKRLKRFDLGVKRRDSKLCPMLLRLAAYLMYSRLPKHGGRSVVHQRFPLDALTKRLAAETILPTASDERIHCAILERFATDSWYL
jgi:hypothetical protein